MSKYSALIATAERMADELCCEYHLRIGHGATGIRGVCAFMSDESAIRHLRKVHAEINEWKHKISLLSIDAEAIRICKELGISTHPETYGQRIEE